LTARSEACHLSAVRSRARDPVEAPPPPFRATLRDGAVAFGIGAAALIAYVSTMYPDVPGGDSGELVGAAASGGVIHPPGYPAYALLARLFTHVFGGALAWRVGLLSAVCDAATASVLYLAALRASRSRGGGLVAAALFAFAPGIWRYAICAEVFALNNLLVALLVLLAFLYDERKEFRYALSGAFVFGLGLANHHTILFTGIPVAAGFFWSGRGEPSSARRCALLALSFGAGLLPYLYLPIEARGHSPISWGAADTWSGFWTHVLRREYGTFQLAPLGVGGATPTAGQTVATWFEDVLAQIGIGGILLGAAGLVALAFTARRDPVRVACVALLPPLLSVGVLAILGNVTVADPFHRGIVARFWQQPDLFVFLWCGLGFATAARFVPKAVGTGAAIAIALLALGLRFREMDRHHSLLVRDYGAEILRAAPPGALLLTKGDLITNTVRYLQLAEGRRPDVRVVDQELLGFSWARDRVAASYPEIAIPRARYAPGAPDGFTMKELLDANVGRGPILVCGGIKNADPSAEATYGLWPFGLCERVRSGSEPVNLDEWIRESEEALPRIDFDGQLHPPGSWEDIVWNDYWAVRQERAAHLLRVSGHDDRKRRYVVLAGEILEEIVRSNPAVPAYVYKSLAVALGRGGLGTPERRARTANAWETYLELAPTDPERDAYAEEVRRLRTSDSP
jgi:hypothetical protein